MKVELTRAEVEAIVREALVGIEPDAEIDWLGEEGEVCTPAKARVEVNLLGGKG